LPRVNCDRQLLSASTTLWSVMVGMPVRRKNLGFTLIEVLIVVVIMSLLAATIIPQFTVSTEDAISSQLDSNQHILQTQIAIYKAQHLGHFPPITGNLQALTKRTNADGTTTGTPNFGPYVLEIPVNSLTDSATVSASTNGAASTGGGWLYNAATGQIWPDGIVSEE
jgi:general secretion pathway protein G